MCRAANFAALMAAELYDPLESHAGLQRCQRGHHLRAFINAETLQLSIILCVFACFQKHSLKRLNWELVELMSFSCHTLSCERLFGHTDQDTCPRKPSARHRCIHLTLDTTCAQGTESEPHVIVDDELKAHYNHICLR